ncbi:MAG: divalent-cation tolerance protein CutA [Proteobacteria bacterium]|nr:divalent-cation tolerance protein CutA [Desulfobacula sp.]MBU3953134.1 divalent-cation tolerance protein CutA [Pseudomonadota bacterium]MBU4133166.1 divalent-cation tolerance protein CutA [Pseudomonadota bacterium]
MKYCMVIVTCANETSARILAREVVENRLAACVQLNPITSIYRWKGKVHTEPEIRLVIKTKTVGYDDLEKFILARHGYELPQIIQIPFEKGLPAYLDWIDKTTEP